MPAQGQTRASGPNYRADSSTKPNGSYHFTYALVRKSRKTPELTLLRVRERLVSA